MGSINISLENKKNHKTKNQKYLHCAPLMPIYIKTFKTFSQLIVYII